MGILLLLLKCIGILLLALLVLVLLVFLVVLCSPIRYALTAEKTTGYYAKAEVRWLFARLCLSGASAQAWQTEIFLFGKTLDAWRKKKADKRKKKQKRKKQETVVTAREKVNPKTEKEEKHQAKPEQQPEQQPPKQSLAQRRTEPKAIQQKPIEPKPAQQAQPTQKPKQPIQPKQGIRRVKLSEIEEEPPKQTEPLEEDEAFFTGEIAETQESEKEGFSWKKTLLQVEDKKGICKAMIRLLRRLAKGVLPHELAFRGTLGTGDPVLTGDMLAVFGILKGKFGKNLVVRGDFSRMCAEDLFVSIKGKIVLGYLCYAMAAFVLTKPVRRLIQTIWKGRKQNGESI